MGSSVHVLAKNGMFLFRFNNGGFGSKWCGVWKKGIKYLDYFAFKIDGAFLSPDDVSNFDFYNSQFSRTTFKTDRGVVTEEVICLDDAVLITIKPGFDAAVSAEFGVNIRNRDENYVAGKRYAVSEADKKVTVSNKDKSLYLIFDKGAFTKKESYGVHVPGLYAREKGFSRYFDDCATQNKYVPGLIEADVKADDCVSFIVSTKDMDNETVYKILKNRMGYPKEYDEIIRRVYSNFGSNSLVDDGLIKDSIDALYSYSNFLEKEIYAGYPYFNQCWIRDARFVLPSFLSLNNPAFVKSTLEKIAGFVSENGLPAFEGSGLFPLDVPPCFIICLYEYFRWTGDAYTVKALGKAVDTLVDVGLRSFERGLMHDKGRSSWMDSLDREYSIEVQALWAEALSKRAELDSLLNTESSDIINIVSQIKTNLMRYRRDGYFSDQLNTNINSANQLFLTFYDVVGKNDAELILENAKDSLLGDYGVYSMSSKDPAYDPHSYQSGSVWPFLTNILAASAFKNGDLELGKRCMGILSKNLGAQCSSRINEILKPDGSPGGCSSQAWSIGMLPYIIDKFLLGIEVNALENEIRVALPKKEVSAKRSLIINGQEVKLEFSGGNLSSNREVVDEGDHLKIFI